MSSFNVVTQDLLMSASQIAQTAHGVESAHAAAASAAGQAGAFDGEPIEADFTGMCARAQAATADLERTLTSLARCVVGASEGYLVTDQGIARASAIPGQVGSSGPELSPEAPVGLVSGGNALSPTPPTSLPG